MSIQRQPVILDFDASVLPLSDTELRIQLRDWQEDIRFGCSLKNFARLEGALPEFTPENSGPVFTGSGDYHHVTLALLRKFAGPLKPGPASVDLVVADNHPDNMRYFFGLHCGSWIRRAARLAWIRRIHVLGITSKDIIIGHACENYLEPFLRKKLTYWSVRVQAGWLRLLGRGAHARSFASADELMNAFLPVLRASADRSTGVYLSVDKDVLSPELVRCNWDQGVFELRHLEALIAGCAGRLAGADITGEISGCAFSGLAKRLLMRLEGRPEAEPDELPLRQSGHQEVNKKLLAVLSAPGLYSRC